MKAKQGKKTNYEALLADVGEAQKAYEKSKSKEAKAKHALKIALRSASKSDLKLLELEYEKTKFRRKSRKAAYKIAEMEFRIWSKSHDADGNLNKKPENEEKPTIKKSRIESTKPAAPAVPKVRKTRRKTAEVLALKAAVTAALDGDDFRSIEGMGLKITQLFHNNGVKTYGQLASLGYDALKGFLRANGYKLANPSTWSDQAKLAAEGKWEELEAFKGSLSRGLAK
jgi:predicted flap endonuclease-1-like 5' DNA nuclease